MRVLITGATGFIGAHLLNSLTQYDCDILGVTRKKNPIKVLPNVKWLIGDLSNSEAMRNVISEFNPDSVIHLSWEGIPDYSEAMSLKNLNSSINFLECVLSSTRCKKIIIAGSSFEYGNQRGLCRESDVTFPNSFFSWAKQSLLNWIKLKSARNEIDYVWFRIFFVYGPGQRQLSLIPSLVNSFSSGEIPNIINPLNENDYIHVSDVARAFQLAVFNNIPAGIYNLGTGKKYSVYEVMKIVENNIHNSSTISEAIFAKSEKKTFNSFWADTSLLKEKLNWLPSMNINMGIDEYIKSKGLL